MGRQTTVHVMSIYDLAVARSEKEMVRITEAFNGRLNKKYNTCGIFSVDDDGLLLFENKDRVFSIFANIDDFVLAILYIAKHYNRKFGGHFNYTDDQTGGSYTGVVYVLSDNNTAIINEYNTDYFHVGRDSTCI